MDAKPKIINWEFNGLAEPQFLKNILQVHKPFNTGALETFAIVFREQKLCILVQGASQAQP